MWGVTSSDGGSRGSNRDDGSGEWGSGVERARGV